ncbi:unnamed protein product [Adineta steineri]|uniref:G-protein coupled receptors family 1 profile domain-containing protein n=1 Tax=Adineta steineri TaxID=433720 RepID=A0A815FTZ8_9BILA|nr:unnamed protein product [Adineta steineri]CAF3637398.1 unnamed protein product [Adineta steineri]CAF3884752.1 unnamed protein product [Adineta steineri]
MGNTSSVNFVLLNQIINRYFPIPLMFFGIIGNILNILVFTRPVFRHNICVNYFLASTVFDGIMMFAGLLSRTLNGFGIDPSQTISALCKLRFFTTYSSATAAIWFISLACVERYLASSTSTYRRQLLTMKRAYMSMIFVILIDFMVYAQQFYCIDTKQQILGAPQPCYQLKKNISCQIVDSLFQFLFEILAPICMMAVFSSLTLRNIRNQRRRIAATQPGNIPIPNIVTANPNQSITVHQLTNISNQQDHNLVFTEIKRRAQKRDIQLVKMLLVQVSVYVISAFPISFYKLYAVATIYQTKSIGRQSIENTIYNLSLISLLLNNSITFYLYTLCGPIFQKELLKLFRLAT